MPTDKTLSNLVINRIPTQEIYNQLKNQGKINEDELYFVEGEGFSIESITESTVDGGINTITFSDGTILNIKNGAAGTTPERGTDYWTDADKAEIKSYVDEAILGGAW